MDCLQQTPQGAGAVPRSCESAGKKDAATPASSNSVEALTILDRLRWAGYVVCMTNMRLPKQALYSQLQNGRQAPGGHRKRFSDTLKASLGKCCNPTDTWEPLTQD
eukprot:g26056.t1